MIITYTIIFCIAICANVIQPFVLLSNTKDTLRAIVIDGNDNYEQVYNDLLKILLFKNPILHVLNLHEYRRSRPSSSKMKKLFSQKDIYKQLSKELEDVDFKKWLRQEITKDIDKYDPPTTVVPPVGLHRKEHIAILVKEIKNAVANNNTSLYNPPYIEHHGLNDYLVLRPGATDKFVTVIPNDIYYNIEKKCVNWLDNCNLKGLRKELMNKITSP